MPASEFSTVPGGVLVSWLHSCGHLGNGVLYESRERAEAVRAGKEGVPCLACRQPQYGWHRAVLRWRQLPRAEVLR
jgi:hypothetical protein